MIALGFGALVIVQAAIEALRGWALRVFGHLLSFQIAGNLVRHLLRLPSDYFEKRHVGDIISRLGSVKPIQDAITQGVVGTVIDGVMACIAAVILFFYSTTLALIVIAAVLLNLALALALFPRMRQRMEEEILAEAKEQTHLMETRAGGDHPQADGPRGRARERLAQPARRDDQRQHLGRQVRAVAKVHPERSSPACRP